MDFQQLSHAAMCWKCERIERLWTDGHTELCQSCLEAETTRYELEVLEDAGISPRSRELSLTDLARSLTLAGRMAAMKVLAWTRDGGGLYLFGPDELRTTLARAAANALWQTDRDQLRLISEAEFIAEYLHNNEGQRRETARIPWLILLDVGMHVPSHWPGRAMHQLLRQRAHSYHAKGTLFVSHRAPASELEHLRASQENTRHAADLFVQLFSQSLVCTVGGCQAHAAELLELTVESEGLEWSPKTCNGAEAR